MPPDVNIPDGSVKRAGIAVQPEVVTNQQVYQAPQLQQVLDEKYARVLQKTTATPSVINIEHAHAVNTAPQNVTDFLGGQPYQSVSIKGDGFTTVVNGGNIFTNTGANKLLAVNIIYTFNKFETAPGSKIFKWYEGA